MSKFLHRLKYYGVGFLLGILMVNVFFKDRGICNMPGTLKLQELQKQKIEFTQHAECRMKCRGISEKEIDELLKSGSINYDKSEVQASPCPTYAIEGKSADKQEIRLIIADCDSTSRIVTAIDLGLEKDTCMCK